MRNAGRSLAGGLAAAIAVALSCGILLVGDVDDDPGGVGAPTSSDRVERALAPSRPTSVRLGSIDRRRAQRRSADSCSNPGPAVAAAPTAPEARAGRGALVGRIQDDLGASVLRPELILTRGPDRIVLDPGRLDLSADGAYRVELPAGAWEAMAKAPEHEGSTKLRVVIAAGAETRAPPLVLERHGILRGEVELPPEVRARLPCSFLFVMEIGDDAPPSIETIDDEPRVEWRRVEVWIGRDQGFELRGCRRGLYRMRLELPRPGRGWVSAWAQSWIEPGQVREGLRLSFAREAPLAFQGRVADDRGVAVAGARISAGVHQVTADAEGRFELRGLEIGPHTVVVTHEGRPPAARRVDFLGVTRPLKLEIASLESR